MPINKIMQAALKALSYPDIQLEKNYKVVRKAINLVHLPRPQTFYKAWDHKIICEGREIPVRIFLSGEESVRPVILFFHGGGFVTGNIDSYNNVCAELARLTKHRIVSVDYRLAPEYKFPCAPEDCFFVANEIFTHSEEYFQISPEQITLMGDSAGGNLAAVVSLMARDRNAFSVSKQILLYPAVNSDYTEQSEFRSVIENGTGYLLTAKKMCDYMNLYQSCEEDRNHPYFAPILSKDFSNQPDTLIITAEYDPLRDEGEAYGEKLRKAHNLVEMHRVEGVLHGFFSLPVKYEPVMTCYNWINKFLYGIDIEIEEEKGEHENETKGEETMGTP